MGFIKGWARWLLTHSVIAAVAWAALWGQEKGAQNVLVAAAWFFAFVAFNLSSAEQATIEKSASKPRGPVPYWLSVTFDAVLIAVLVWFGWWFTALAWLVQLAGGYSYREKVMKARAGMAAAT